MTAAVAAVHAMPAELCRGWKPVISAQLDCTAR